ncbi:MAG: alpha-galactosidase [Candidatus Helarchaeota archaeon]
MVSSSKIDNVLILENKFEKIEINLQLGLFSIFNFEINSYIIKNATTGVVFKTKKEDEESSEETSEKEVFLSLTDRQKKIFETEDIQDEIGKGIKATIRLFNVEHQTILALEIYLYDDTPGIQIQASLTNKFGIKSIYDIYPLLILSSSNQGCIEFGDIEKWRLFKIGYQSWSNTRIMTPFDDDSLPYISWAKLPHHINYFEKRNYGQIRSNYFTVIKNIESNYNILIGYLSHKDQFTQFIYDFDPITKTFVSFKARSQADGINIEDEETIKSERLFIIISNDEIKNLNTYVKFTSKISEALTWHEIPKGYCTWYNYFQNITEDDCVKNLLQIKSHKSSIPINFFQLDDGYQIICGDWPEPPNKKFPHGMKWLVEKIKDAGLKPGLWIAPFLISPLSKLYKEHPDWVPVGNFLREFSHLYMSWIQRILRFKIGFIDYLPKLLKSGAFSI